jgi:hypothetical protein
MNRTFRLAAAAVAAGIVLAPAAQAAQSGPSTGEQLAVEAAKKGPDELRRFIHRTRMIYGLQYEQFRSAP